MYLIQIRLTLYVLHHEVFVAKNLPSNVRAFINLINREVLGCSLADIDLCLRQ
jgi:hypothetical protein